MSVLDEKLQEKTKESYFDELVQACVDEKLSTTAWQPGEPIRAVISILARVLAALWSVVALPALKAAFLDYATGAWLTLFAWTNYNVKRKGAEFASRALTVENRGAFAGAIPAGSIRVKNSDGKTFTNTTGTAFLAAWPGSPDPYPTVALTFTADEAGTASDTPAGEISETPITAPASGLFVLTNTAALLGSEEETDEDLRVRCRASTGPLSPAGPRDAYRFVALSTTREDGSVVSVNRVRVSDVGGCALEVNLAGRSGATPGAMGDAGTDVCLVYAAFLKSVLPVGLGLTCYGASEISATLIFDLWVDIDSGVSVDEATDAAYAAVAVYLSEVPIGGYRTTPIVNYDDPGTVYIEKLIAVASESIKGIVKATCVNLLEEPMTDIEIPYDGIPDVTHSIRVHLVEQS